MGDETCVTDEQFMRYRIDHQRVRIEMQTDGVAHVIGVGRVLLDDRKLAYEACRVDTMKLRIVGHRVRPKASRKSGKKAALVQIKNHQPGTLATSDEQPTVGFVY